MLARPFKAGQVCPKSPHKKDRLAVGSQTVFLLFRVVIALWFRAALFAGLAHRAHAAGADVDAEFHAVNGQALALNVRFERAIGAPLRKADVVSE